jgi:hypothetical protein
VACSPKVEPRAVRVGATPKSRRDSGLAAERRRLSAAPRGSAAMDRPRVENDAALSDCRLNQCFPAEKRLRSRFVRWPVWKGGRREKRRGIQRSEVVGTTGFEPATSCSQSRCSTRLSYVPNPGRRSCPVRGAGRNPDLSPEARFRDSGSGCGIMDSAKQVVVLFEPELGLEVVGAGVGHFFPVFGRMVHLS